MMNMNMKNIRKQIFFIFLNIKSCIAKHFQTQILNIYETELKRNEKWKLSPIYL